jgi:metal-responsive CopG/Arc/MetJ family transcriptional regulator
MKEIKRVSAGVKFESDVLRFVDLVAAEHQRNRSFIINQIIRAYARALQQQKQIDLPKEPERPVAPITF